MTPVLDDDLARFRRPRLGSLVGLVALVLLTACTPGPAPQVPQAPDAPRIAEPFDVQGHRGARGLLPENTLEGFRRALELGVTTLELDTGVTADGVVVVSHDPYVSPDICRLPDDAPQLPTPGRTALHKELTVEELQRYDCGSLNPSRRRFPEPQRQARPGARIPTLIEVVELAAKLDPQVQFNIETKVVPDSAATVPVERFVAAVVAVIREHDLLDRATLQSFDWRALKIAKELEPRLTTVALLSPSTADPQWLAGLAFDRRRDDPVTLLRSARTFVDLYSPHWETLLPERRQFLGSTAAEIRAAGFPVVPWTVNSRRDMERILAEEIDGLITDYPDRLLELLAEQGVEVR